MNRFLPKALPLSLLVSLLAIASNFEKIQRVSKQAQERSSSIDAGVEALRSRLGNTALANSIVQIEEAAGREKPLRLRLDICEAPSSYPIQEGRLLVKCSEQVNLACLDINSKSKSFGNDEGNTLESLSKGARFGFDNVQCDVLKK